MFIGRIGGNFCNLCGPGGEAKSSFVGFFFALSMSLVRAFDGVP
jgi:hypothetical protein